MSEEGRNGANRYGNDLLEQVLSRDKFSDNSYGFRPLRSAKQAVEKCRGYINAGHTWTVNIDLSKYFDTINHDKLIRILSEDIKDSRVISLVRKYLQSGVMINGVFTNTEEGAPQGGFHNVCH
ncbi:hypothetical protein KPL55_10430 [Clostridium lacusfryxellense]|nr:hypothetical protein [Clostridium lacusfryxellense]